MGWHAKGKPLRFLPQFWIQEHLPNTSLVRQENDCLMDVDCLDALHYHQRQDNDSMRACVGYQESNASYLQPVINAPPPTRFPGNDEAMYQSGFPPIVRPAQPRDGSKRACDSRARNNANNFKTRKRVRPPSLPCSASPSPSPPPARLRLRTPPHRPNSKAKSKAKVGTSKISNYHLHPGSKSARHRHPPPKYDYLYTRTTGRLPPLLIVLAIGKLGAGEM